MCGSLSKPTSTPPRSNDELQAQERVFDRIAKQVRSMGMVARGEATVTKSEIFFPALRSKIVALPADFAGAAGAIFGISSWTELWAFRFENHVRLWEELTPIPNRRSLRIVDSYAGFTGDSPILEPMWARAIAGELLDDELPIFANGRLSSSRRLAVVVGSFFRLARGRTSLAASRRVLKKPRQFPRRARLRIPDDRCARCSAARCVRRSRALDRVIRLVMLDSGADYSSAYDQLTQGSDFAYSGGKPTLGTALEWVGADSDTATDVLRPRQANRCGPKGTAEDPRSAGRRQEGQGQAREEEVLERRVRARMLELDAPEQDYPKIPEQVLSGEA